MEKIIRKGIAFIPKELKEFDKVARKKGYKNRSEAIRDLIRNNLIEERQNFPNEIMIATLTIVYNHHEHDVLHELTHIQHNNPDLIRSSVHTHIDENNCLEVLVLKGKANQIKQFSDSILSTKGVKHGKLVLTGVQ
jgi:CopG family transcriptional regulator, nickel-responsive regulator